jgi:hypothetical protein
MSDRPHDICVVGAGAAGLMAAIWSRRTAPTRTVLLLDGARNLGAKILISGGGRCNVTHEHIDEAGFSGSTPMAIRKVLRRFGVAETVAFFRELGVELVREETGKLFPAANRARFVLEALLREAKRCGVSIVHPRRVEAITPLAAWESGTGPDRTRFRVGGAWGSIEAERVVLATGGKSVPKTGSDGHGHEMVSALGHGVSRLFPALAPLLLPRRHFLCDLRGIAAPVALELRSGTGKRLHVQRGALLCTHFGLSGPVVLDMSRHYLDAAHQDPRAGLFVHWLPERTPQDLDRELQQEAATPAAFLARHLPARLARALCDAAGLGPDGRCRELPRQLRRALVQALTAMALPVTGSRGFAVAEATAGGVPLAELDLRTLESRRRPGLYLCGEICDADGRIGGFNFQWAWSSGWVAGLSLSRGPAIL